MSDEIDEGRETSELLKLATQARAFASVLTPMTVNCQAWTVCDVVGDCVAPYIALYIFLERVTNCLKKGGP